MNSVVTPTGMVLERLSFMKISEYRNSFQERVNANMPAERMPGRARGIAIRIIACQRLAPSTRADSSSSRGMPLK